MTRNTLSALLVFAALTASGTAVAAEPRSYLENATEARVGMIAAAELMGEGNTTDGHVGTAARHRAEVAFVTENVFLPIISAPSARHTLALAGCHALLEARGVAEDADLEAAIRTGQCPGDVTPEDVFENPHVRLAFAQLAFEGLRNRDALLADLVLHAVDHTGGRVVFLHFDDASRPDAVTPAGDAGPLWTSRTRDAVFLGTPAYEPIPDELVDLDDLAVRARLLRAVPAHWPRYAEAKARLTRVSALGLWKQAELAWSPSTDLSGLTRTEQVARLEKAIGLLELVPEGTANHGLAAVRLTQAREVLARVQTAVATEDTSPDAAATDAVVAPAVAPKAAPKKNKRRRRGHRRRRGGS